MCVFLFKTIWVFLFLERCAISN